MGIKQKIANFYPIRIFRKFLQSIKIPGLEGMSLYELLGMYLNGLVEGRITNRCSAVSWSLFLALFPFLLFLYSILPYLPNFEMIEQSLYNYLVARIFPESQANQIENYVSIISKRTDLGWYTILFAIFIATNGTDSLITGFTRSARDVKAIEARPKVEQYIFSAIFTVTYTLIALTFLWFINYLVGPGADYLKKYIGYVQLQSMLVQILLFISGFVFVTFSLGYLYYYGVIFKAKFRWVLSGAVLTTFLLFLLFQGFAFYIENFNSYNLLYGSVSTLLLVMLFIYFTVLIILLGFELNVAILYAKERQGEDDL